jgi:hypothetical protein
VTHAQAEASLNLVAAQLGREHPTLKVGKRFRTGRTDNWIEIVGLIQTGKYESLTEADKPVAFHPLSQWYNPTTTIVARSAR